MQDSEQLRDSRQLRDKLIDIAVWILIVILGLGVAYVTFEILSSTASTEVQGYSVEGALAGFLVSAGVLTSIYLQVRKSSGELEDLERRNRELQGKLLRGAPRPLHFETEVAERERIVLARPGDWRRSGGVIFDYRLPLSDPWPLPGHPEAMKMELPRLFSHQRAREAQQG